jgi:hypothetical protein
MGPLVGSVVVLAAAVLITVHGVLILFLPDRFSSVDFVSKSWNEEAPVGAREP